MPRISEPRGETTRREATVGESAIPMDLLNPGQVFACIGLVEAADVLLGHAEGVFDWSDPAAIRFRVRAAGSEAPVARVLRFLEAARAIAAAPADSPNHAAWNASWGERPISIEQSRGYPYPDPPSPATLVCNLSDGTDTIPLEHWGDETERDNVKFWAGAAGYPGAALARDALALIRGRALDAVDDPFAVSAPQSSSFRLDWRRDYIPLDAGFSLNAHGDIVPTGFPLVELLAAVGLSNARPRRPDRRDKLVYTYGVAGRGDPTTSSIWLPPRILRAALGGAPLPFPTKQFRMLLGWPGKEGQARAITSVTEENIA